MARKRLDLSIQCDYRRPLEVRAVVAELRAKLAPTDWAMMEALAMEVLATAAIDQETVVQVAAIATDRLKAGRSDRE